MPKLILRKTYIIYWAIILPQVLYTKTIPFDPYIQMLISVYYVSFIQLHVHNKYNLFILNSATGYQKGYFINKLRLRY